MITIEGIEPQLKSYSFTKTKCKHGKTLSFQKQMKIGKGQMRFKQKEEFRGKWTPGSLLKIAFVVMCWGCCSFQVIDIIRKHSAYPMDVNVVAEEMKLLQLPGITICNNNILLNKGTIGVEKFLLMRVTLIERIMKEKMLEKFDELVEVANGSLKLFSNITKEYMRNTSLTDIMELSPSKDDFIKEMECDSQFDPKDQDFYNTHKKCDKQEVIESLQRNGICFTYFHKMAQHGPTHKPACHMMGTCVNKEPVFDTNEIVRFELNFQPKEYTTKDIPVSGRLSIHDNTEIGDSLSNAYNFEPGYYYQFYIKVQSTSMLKKPYSTNCLDYVMSNSEKFKEKLDYTSILLSRKQCTTVCISKFTMNACNCWPPELAYTRNNELDPNNTYKWCQWKFDSKASYSHGYCYLKNKRMKCLMRCQPSCWTDHYEVRVQKLSFEYFGREEWNSENKTLKECCSVVSIRYVTTERTTHEYKPKFKTLDMLCYVGGLFSMYTGMSLVAVYDYLTIMVIFTKGYVTHHRM